MSQVLNTMYIFIHLCEKCQYLLSVTYIMACTGFVFGFEDYPLSVWLLNPSIYIFPLGVNAIGGCSPVFYHMIQSGGVNVP